MGFLREADLGGSFAPIAAFRHYFGYVPNVCRCQTLLPRLIEAETGFAASIVFRKSTLSQRLKERLLLTLAVAQRSSYWATTHYQILSVLGEPDDQLDRIFSDYRHSNLPEAEIELFGFAVKLCLNGASVSRVDINALDAHGWTNEFILETVLIAAWAKFESTVAAGVGATPDFPPLALPHPPAFGALAAGHGQSREAGPYLAAPEPKSDRFAPFSFFREQFGFVPNVFRGQATRPDVIEAEAEAIRLVLLTQDHLARLQKERILLAVSAANENAYFVAVHGEILASLGVSPEVADSIALDHRRAGLGQAETALLDFAFKLAEEPSGFGIQDVVRLRSYGYRDEQILEAIAMTSLTNFLNTVQFGMGATPDFEPRVDLGQHRSKITNLFVAVNRPTEGSLAVDPDAETIAKVQNGDHDAFEEIVDRHSRRVYRILVAVLGSPEEARDAMQDTFLKAFQHLGEFQGRSKFSTWLVSIASNTAVQMLRDRKPLLMLDDDPADTDEGFRPRQIRAWTEDPEQLYSRTETRTLVEASVMQLPAKYRVVLVLRDIEQLSIEASAAALGLGIAALKSRHLRGRLMLREALTPHFAASAKGGTA